MTRLAAYLHTLRDRAGRSQIEVSAGAALHETYYGKIESGQRRPSADVLRRILDYLDSAPDERTRAIRLLADDLGLLTLLETTIRPPVGPAESPVVPLRKRPRAARRRKLAAVAIALPLLTSWGSPSVQAAPLVPERDTLPLIGRWRRLHAA